MPSGMDRSTRSNGIAMIPDVVSLTNPDGTPFAFKPGTTWFEVVGMKSTLTDRSELALHPSNAVKHKGDHLTHI